MIQEIKNWLRNLLIRLHVLRDKSEEIYISKLSDDKPWVYVAYISRPFFHKDDDEYMSTHQNKREAIVQTDIFNELGYNVYVQHYSSTKEIPNIKFDIVFGHEPNFVRAANKNPSALKIHYVPGAYVTHRNGQIKKMTDYVNKTYNSSIPYRRLLNEDISCGNVKTAYNIADSILLIGSKYTVETFPIELHNKIVTIHQSTQLTHTIDNIDYSPENEYFFMGSGGNLLKGISLLLEFFSMHKDYKLNIVGPVEADVKEALKELISDNIIMHGFVDVNSDNMIDIMSRCNFVIYPSGSEGGMPGAVLNSMKNGLIPVVTKWAAFDEIEEYGYILDEWTVDAIAKGIAWSQSLSQDEVVRLKRSGAAFVERTFNIDNYKKEFRSFIIQNTRKN